MSPHHALLGLTLSLPLGLGALSFSALGTATQESAPADDEPLAVGEEAPAFVLNDQSGELVRVGGESDEWVVLAFYPKALTGG
ncbi:MAG: hypothetical protein AAGB93_03635 [Planctomycetota bacterium]